MKTHFLKFLAVLTLGTSCVPSLFAHSDAELGPNGGRMLEFSKDESMHGEVTVQDNQMRIMLLDKAMKPVAIDKQTLTATTADRTKPEKLSVETKGNLFIVPLQKGEDHWTIFQFRASPAAKPVTARLHYESQLCGECQKPEWLCACSTEKDAKPKK